MLNEQGFKAVFGISHEEFSAWGKWKQSQEKKKYGLRRPELTQRPRGSKEAAWALTGARHDTQ
jgi:hypothetical protein